MTREQALLEFIREELRKRRIAERSFLNNGFKEAAERCGVIAAELSTIIALSERGDHLIGREVEP